MLSENPKKIEYNSINDFTLMIKYSSLERSSHIRGSNLHIHKRMEIYINLSGDVSFLVGKRLYPISRGDIIIALPNEQHHCVYNSDALHKCYWLLIDIEKNPALFDFFKKELKSPLITPTASEKERIIEICDSLCFNNNTEFDKFSLFFEILSIIKSSTGKPEKPLNVLPKDISATLDYIDNNISESISVAQICNKLFLSESTLERRFKKYLNMRPLAYIQKQKILRACEHLQNGANVLEAGSLVGYCDNSYFIGLFKKHFGITPAQYKKQFKNQI